MHWKGCPICGPRWFHRWSCPELRRSIYMATAVLTAGAALILLVYGRLNWMPGGLILVAAWVASAAQLATSKKGPPD